MKRISDRFIAEAGACNGLAQLHHLLSDVTLELGFDHYALVDHASLRFGELGGFRIDNYPEAWVDELIDGCKMHDDPVHLACRYSNTGFRWSEIGALVSLDCEQERVLERSSDFGLGPGFTIPSNVRNGPSASCSFAVSLGRDLPYERLACAELVGAHALRALRRLHDAAPAQARPFLSGRQVECLALIARGKTDWEIARILKISVETVHFYVKRARSAYGSVSRAQLIAQALRDAWIEFDDQTPPNGGLG